METIKIKATIQGERIDKFLTNYLQADFDFSRSLVQKYILDGHVKANGEVVTNNYNVLLDDEIEIMIPEPENLDVKGEDIPFEILFEDDDLIVLNKPNNLVVHPAPGNQSGTLVNALIYKMKKLSSISGVLRPGIVHRLDKLTTGLMIVAKSDTAHKKIVEMLKKGEIKRFTAGLCTALSTKIKDELKCQLGVTGVTAKKWLSLVKIQNTRLLISPC
jgi:23S rRNA pseudouridine1911/1915/1917 synthase